MPRDAYEVLGVGRAADETEIKKAFRRLARELHPDTNTEDPQAEDKFKEAAEAYEILSDPDRRRQYDAYGHEGLRSGGYAPNFEGFGSVSDLFSAFFGSGGFDSAFGTRPRPRRADAGRRRRRRGRDRSRPGRARRDGRGQLRGRRALRHLPWQRRRARHADRDMHALPRLRPAAGRLAHALRPARPHRGLRRLRWRRSRAGAALLRPAPARAGCTSRARCTSTCPPASPTASGSGSAVAATRATAAGPTATSTSTIRVREDERFVRDQEDLHTVIDVAAPLAALGTTVQVPSLDGDIAVEVPAGTQPGEIITLRCARAAAAAARAHGRPARARQRRDPAQAQPRAARPARAPRGLADRRQPGSRTRGCSPSSSARWRGDATPVVRLGIRVRRDQAELALAALLPILQAGAEETEPDRGRGRVRGLRAARGAARARRRPCARRRRADRRVADRCRARLGAALARVPAAGRGRRRRAPAADPAALAAGRGEADGWRS